MTIRCREAWSKKKHHEAREFLIQTHARRRHSGGDNDYATSGDGDRSDASLNKETVEHHRAPRAMHVCGSEGKK